MMKICVNDLFEIALTGNINQNVETECCGGK